MLQLEDIQRLEDQAQLFFDLMPSQLKRKVNTIRFNGFRQIVNLDTRFDVLDTLILVGALRSFFADYPVFLSTDVSVMYHAQYNIVTVVEEAEVEREVA